MAISVAIFLLTFAYVLALGKPKAVHRLDVKALRYYYDWRIMVAVTAPLAAWTLAGAGKISFDQNAPVQQTVRSGLTGQFLLIALTLSSVGLILRFGPRLLVPAMLAQVAILASLGQRGAVVIALILLIYAAARIDVDLSRRSMVGIGAFAVIVLLVLTAARETTGREVFASGEGAAARFASLGSGISNIFSQETVDGLELTASYRLDGNAFPSLQLARINEGREGLGLAPFVNNLRLAVPSAIDPGKLSLPLEARSEKYFSQVRFGLPLRDSLYTQLGGTVGYYGVPGLLVIAFLMGIGLGRLDSGLLTGPTPKRLLIGVGALDAVGHYSASLDHWTVVGRGVLLLVVAIWFLQFARKRFEARASRRK